jgi:hypothetical protein
MKHKYGVRLFSIFLLALLFSMCLCVSVFAAEEVSIAAPAGNQDYSFAIDMLVNESGPYAGIQFELTLSDDSALSFDSFTLGTDVSGATPYPFIASNGSHSFGFWTGANLFQGNLKVGTLNFTYTGSAPQTVTITDMMVARIDTGAKTSYGTKKPSPAYIIRVSRGNGGSEETEDSDDPGGPGDVNNPGGSEGSGGVNNPVSSGSAGSPGGSGNTEISIDIPDGGTPLASGNPFTDVNNSDWFYNDVMYIYENGLMNGTGGGVFSPQTSTTRGMIVTVLYRATGSPGANGLANPFDDVTEGQYYTDAVKWGVENEIILGYGNGRFGPGDNITREQLAAILYRYERFSGKIPPDTATGRAFADETGISEYAKNAVSALVTQGIINGKPGDIFDPRGQATRAEVAAMLHRFILNTAGNSD